MYLQYTVPLPSGSLVWYKCCKLHSVISDHTAPGYHLIHIHLQYPPGSRVPSWRHLLQIMITRTYLFLSTVIHAAVYRLRNVDTAMVSFNENMALTFLVEKYSLSCALYLQFCRYNIYFIPITARILQFVLTPSPHLGVWFRFALSTTTHTINIEQWALLQRPKMKSSSHVHREMQK